MARNSVEQIDKDEKLIMSILEKDAKENIDTLADRCGFSRQKVWRIIKRLEKTKLIWGYAAINGGEKMEVGNFVVLIKKSSKPADEKTINSLVGRELDEIAEKMEVTIENSFFVHGEFDWILTFNAKDLRAAKKFHERLLKLYTGMVAGSTLLETLVPLKKQGIINPNIDDLREYL